VIGLITSCLVVMVAVMGDVFALVYNFHVPLALKVAVRPVVSVVIWLWSLYSCVLV
jgi:hypothetical protein